jgi:RTX calcium-binding nonapeptide repeat (4 copies)
VDSLLVDYDETRPDLILLADPQPPFEPIAGAGECVAAVDPVHNTPEVRCPLAAARTILIDLLAGDDQLGVSVHRGDELIADAVFPSLTTVRGGDGDDELQTAGAGSSAFGEGGDDQIWSRLGDNLLFGGEGRDRLLDGEGGNDRLYGGGGADVLAGWSGKDRLDGGGGRDTLRGGVGRDTLFAIDGIQDKRIQCDGGRGDYTRTDWSLDPRPRGCERIAHH